MTAVLSHAIGDVAIEDVPEPMTKGASRIIIRRFATAIGRTGPCFVRGVFPE